MKSNEKFDAKVAELKINGIQTFSKEEVLKNPDLMNLGENRGIPFSFMVGEVLTLPETMVYVPHSFTRDGTQRFTLWFLAESQYRGVIEVPIAIFCRVPSLESERELLFTEENALGKSLSEQIKDVRRGDILHDRKTVTVFNRMQLHQDSWYTDDAGVSHRVPDSEDLPNRRTLWCYQFK